MTGRALLTSRPLVWLLGIAVLLLVLAFMVPASPLHPHWYGNDAAVYWHGAKTFVRQGDLYAVQPDGTYFTYPPFAALVFSPLALLPLTVAQHTVVMLGAACTLGLIATTAYGLGLRGIRLAVCCLAAAIPSLLLYVALSGYLVGQVDALVALLVLLDAVRPPSRRFPRGILTGVAIALKVTPAAFVGAYLMRGRWRTALVALASAAVCVLAGSAPRPADASGYFGGALTDTSRVGPVDVDQNQSLAGAIARTASTGMGRLTGEHRIVWRLCCLVVILLGAYAVYRLRDRAMPATLAAALVALLISPISWMHHWVWTIPVIGWLGMLAWQRRSVLAGLLALAGLIVSAYGPQWFFPPTAPFGAVDYLGVNALVWWGLVTLVALPHLPQLRQSGPGRS